MTINKGDKGYAVITRFNVKCPVLVRRVLPDGRLKVQVTKTTEHLYKGVYSVITPDKFTTN